MGFPTVRVDKMTKREVSLRKNNLSDSSLATLVTGDWMLRPSSQVTFWQLKAEAGHNKVLCSLPDPPSKVASFCLLLHRYSALNAGGPGATWWESCVGLSFVATRRTGDRTQLGSSEATGFLISG